jgi:hypothetical protein
LCLSAEFSVQEGTAKDGADYVVEPQLLTWADGETSDKQIQIKLTDDKVGDEVLTMTLSNPKGGAVIDGPFGVRKCHC